MAVRCTGLLRLDVVADPELMLKWVIGLPQVNRLTRS